MLHFYTHKKSNFGVKMPYTRFKILPAYRVLKSPSQKVCSWMFIHGLLLDAMKSPHAPMPGKMKRNILLRSCHI